MDLIIWYIFHVDNPPHVLVVSFISMYDIGLTWRCDASIML